MDAHALVSKVKEMAIELGRTPLRQEFEKQVRGGKHHLTRAFGNWTALLHAAGLESSTRFGDKPRTIDNSVFERSIESHIDSYEPRVAAATPCYPSIAVISDIHWPFHSQRVIDRFMEYVGDVKPDHVIIDGDAWDRYSYGRFPRSHNVFTPREEDAMARKLNAEFWDQVKKISPNSVCTQMLGNHEIRPMKQILEAYPQAQDWIAEAMKRDFSFPGVKTIFDHREELLLLGDICIHHGYKTQLGAHRDYTLLNCISGHTHKGGVVFRRIQGRTLWELNCGLAGDPEAKGLSYTPQKITIWTPGFGVVTKLGPQFVAV